MTARKLQGRDNQQLSESLEKQCTKCRKKKPVAEFSGWLDKRTGAKLISPKCKLCVAKYSRRRYKAKREELRAQMKERYAENRGSAIAKAKAYYEANKDQVRESRRKHYDANKSVVLLRIAQWKVANFERYRAAQDRWAKAHPEKVRDAANKYARANRERVADRWRAMRMMVFEAYGGDKCNCCGESIYEFLTIDHIDNDGAAHRAAIGVHLYRWIIEHDYPAGFQVLCFNCNSGKHRCGGVCPHKTLESPTTIP